MLDKFVFKLNRKKISQKGIRFIFCINSGRAGSEYLSNLLGSADNVVSFHEPEPQMIGEHLHSVTRNGLQSTFSKRQIKSKAIAKAASKLSEQSVYIETSHMFIKTFYDVVLKDFKNVEVVHLRRDLLQTLNSFVQLNYFSSQNTTWPDWMISPNTRTSAIRPIDADNNLDHIDLTIAYLIDIEARAAAFRQKFPYVPYHEADIKDLNDFNKVKELFTNLGLSFTTETNKIIGGKINQRLEAKKRFANHVTEEQLKSRISIYLQKGEKLGITFPDNILNYL